jgi:hypothetical protein
MLSTGKYSIAASELQRSLPHAKKPVTPTGSSLLRGDWGEGVDEERNHMTARKPGPLYKSFNLLSTPGGLYRVLVNPLICRKRRLKKKSRLSSLFRRGFHYIAVLKKPKAFLSVQTWLSLHSCPGDGDGDPHSQPAR